MICAHLEHTVSVWNPRYQTLIKKTGKGTKTCHQIGYNH